jgi:hypothetical protein
MASNPLSHKHLINSIVVEFMTIDNGRCVVHIRKAFNPWKHQIGRYWLLLPIYLFEQAAENLTDKTDKRAI